MISESKRLGDPRLLSDAELLAELKRRGFEGAPAGAYERLARERERADRDAGLAARVILREVTEGIVDE